MAWNTHSILFVLPLPLVLILFAGNVAQAAQCTTANPCLIEVFTTTELAVTAEAAIHLQPNYGEIELYVYDLDGIQRIKMELSKDLTVNSGQSKRIALQRIHTLDDHARARMQRSAIGLARAMQYGIKRYPAIVFDGQAVVYGVTDLKAALTHYQTWRTEIKP